MWADDGFVVRVPGRRRAARPGAAASPTPTRSSALVVRAARRRRRCSRRASARTPAARCSCRAAGPGKRTPLWQQRKRAADLLAVAARFGSFPMMLETYRECLRDVFDLPALVDLLRRDPQPRGPRRDRRLADAVAVRRVAALRLRRQLSSTTATRRWPSAARRRCRSTRRSCASCSARPSCASCSTPRPWTRIERDAAAPAPRSTTRARPTPCTTCCCASAISPPTRSPRAARAGRGRRRRRRAGRDPARRCRCASPASRATSRSRTPRATATRSACRCRRACRRRCSSRSPIALGDLVLRYARTHGPFTAAERGGALRGSAPAVVERTLRRLRRRPGARRGRVPPRRPRREWCDAEVLRTLAAPVAGARCARRSSRSSRTCSAASCRLARPGRAAPRPRRAARAIEQLQGAPLPASVLEREILPARVARLHAGASRHAGRRRRGGLGRRRAARRARRPHRALPRRPTRGAAAAPRPTPSEAWRNARRTPSPS